MELTYQTTSNTSFPYIWCHGCERPLEEGLVIQCTEGRERKPNLFWLRLCPSCLDDINTYMRRIIQDGLAASS